MYRALVHARPVLRQIVEKPRDHRRRPLENRNAFAEVEIHSSLRERLPARMIRSRTLLNYFSLSAVSSRTLTWEWPSSFRSKNELTNPDRSGSCDTALTVSCCNGAGDCNCSPGCQAAAEPDGESARAAGTSRHTNDGHDSTRIRRGHERLEWTTHCEVLAGLDRLQDHGPSRFGDVDGVRSRDRHLPQQQRLGDAWCGAETGSEHLQTRSGAHRLHGRDHSGDEDHASRREWSEPARDRYGRQPNSQLPAADDSVCARF